jgi:hypothetical protein
VTSRLNGREVGSRWDRLLCIIDVETSTEDFGATGRARSKAVGTAAVDKAAVDKAAVDKAAVDKAAADRAA